MERQNANFQRLGRYLLVERLAAGGMAEIFKAKTHGAHGFEKTLVIKRLASHLASDPDYVEMFIAEAKVMVALNHPKIVQVFDFGEVDGQFFLAMEYVDGLDLLAVLRRCAARRCRPSVEIAAHIVAEVLDALEYAHTLRDKAGRPRNIVHRDISPSNIFLSRLGEVKLGDFGIATGIDRVNATEPGTLRGKFGYLAPENVTGQSSDCRADLFSTGVILAELLTIRRLFVGETDLDVLMQVRDARLDRLYQHIDRIPLGLRPIMASALARDAQTRYQDAASFRDALHRFLFETRQMVHRTDVRRFIEQLESEDRKFPPSQAALHPVAPRRPTRTTAITRPPTAEDLTPLSLMMDVGSQEHQRIPSVVGKKRKVVLSPPPRPQPVPIEALQTKEAPTIKTDELVKIEPERPETYSFHEAVDQRASLEDSVRTAAVSEATEGVAHSPSAVRKLITGRLASYSEWSQQSRPTDQGSLRESSLVKQFFQLAVGEETGLLVVRSRDSLKEIYFVNGDPVFIMSDRAEELFGQYLVDQGILRAGELSMALAILPQFDGKIGDALVALKLMTAVQVTRHLTRQVRDKLVDTLHWEEGGWAYYQGKECEHESAPLGLDAYEVLGSAALALRDGVVMRRLSPWMHVSCVAAANLPVPPEVFRLGARSRSVYEKLVNSPHTLAELLERFDDAEARDQFARVAFLLLETGFCSARS